MIGHRTDGVKTSTNLWSVFGTLSFSSTLTAVYPCVPSHEKNPFRPLIRLATVCELRGLAVHMALLEVEYEFPDLVLTYLFKRG